LFLTLFFRDPLSRLILFLVFKPLLVSIISWIFWITVGQVINGNNLYLGCASEYFGSSSTSTWKEDSAEIEILMESSSEGEAAVSHFRGQNGPDPILPLREQVDLLQAPGGQPPLPAQSSLGMGWGWGRLMLKLITPLLRIRKHPLL